MADRFESMLERSDLGLAPDSMARPQLVALRRLVIAAMQGLAVMRIVDDEEAHADSVLGMQKDLCRRSLAADGSDPS